MVVILMAVAVGLPFKGLKERKPAKLFIQALVRLVQGPRSPTFLHVRPHQRRHLSLNTPLMKVIHFNGASFQTPVIKVCGALDWEVVETARGPALQINSHASGPRPDQPKNLGLRTTEMKTTFLNEAGMAGGANMSGGYQNICL